MFTTNQQQQPPFYSHYTGQPVLAGTSSQELEGFVGAKFYCLRAVADGRGRGIVFIFKRDKNSHSQQTTTTVLQPLYRSTCVSRHLQLRTGGFC